MSVPVAPASLDLASILDAEGENLFLATGVLHVFGDPNSVWFIRSGSIDLYAVQRRNNIQTSPRKHIGSLGPGNLIWGIQQSADEDGVHILSRVAEDVRLSRIPITRLIALGRASILASRAAVEAIDAWILLLLQGVTSYVRPRQQPKTTIAVGEELSLADNDRVVSRKGVVWAELLDGVGHYADIKDVGSNQCDRLIPLTPQGWVRQAGVRTLRGHSTEAMLRMEDPAYRMVMIHAWMFHLLAYGFRNAISMEVGRLRRRASETAQDVQRTLLAFADLVNHSRKTPAEVTNENALLETCVLVGKTAGMTITPPLFVRRRAEERPLDINDIAASSQLRVRQVILRSGWWKKDVGPLVGFLKSNDQPVALIPRSPITYVLRNPVSAEEKPVTEETAADLWPGAFTFYPALPNQKITPFDILRFVFGQCRSDLATILLTGALGGLIAAAVPMATAYIFGAVIPGHQTTQLIQAGLMLTVAAFSSTIFHFTRDIAQLRIEGRVAGVLQAAFMDRLLRLPNAFFTKYSAGDLAQRTLAIEVIRRTLTGMVLGSLFSGIFSIFSFALLFVYSPLVAVIASILIAVLIGMTIFCGLRLIDAVDRAEDMAGAINSIVLELITGIVKLRLAGAEDRAFNLWGKKFAAFRNKKIESRSIMNNFQVFWSGFEILGLTIVFAAIGFLGGKMSTSAFLAFIAAFSSLFAAIHEMARSVLVIYSIVPKYRRAEPILTTLPEINISKTDPGALSGEFEANGVVFRYSQNGPRILDGLSIKVQAGSFVALVGPSGCGKSTLMRLLLGLDHPELGGIYYDGRDLRGLNLQSVRQQIGVVLQNNRLMPGSIYENIRGATRATVDDCWEAAAATGLEQDIRAMPMTMHTVLTEGASTLSGGQVQRILLARAIVSKPRILLLDEATSALDNITQAVVIENLDRLSITRLVIAHRLSTIINADAIYVLSNGQVIESGNYHELLHHNGLFSELARRQSL
ncbi:NHLP bacteriocin export ABC transporter permease/ATPase subunit [Azospirillaceae bacterium]